MSTPDVIRGLVTTIIPVHNRPGMLREAVTSVLSQSYGPIEVIIVDDASTDETPTVCQELASTCPQRVQVVTLESNEGPGIAREAGRQRAGGEFIQYLDSDDILFPKKFEVQIAALRERPDCGVAYGMTIYHNLETGAVESPLKRTGERIEVMFPSFLQSRWWSTSTPLFRRSVTDLAGPWLPLSQEEDWEYDCRVASMGTRLAYCREFVSETRAHGDDRLSRSALSTARVLADRSAAHVLILEHARKARIGNDVPEMQHFSRELFLLARQCGAAGLVEESKQLFALSQQSSLKSVLQQLQILCYRSLALALGWRYTGRLAQSLDRIRRLLR